MFSYRTILKRAWSIVSKNPYLWFLGLFAAFISSAAEYRIISEPLHPSHIVDWYYRLSALSGPKMWRGDTWQLLLSNPGRSFLAIFILLLILAIALFIVWLAVSSQLAIIKNTEKIIKSKHDKDDDNFHYGLREGSLKFWPAFILNLLGKVLISLAMVLTALPMLFPLHRSLLLNLLFVLMFLIFIPLAISISLITKYAISFVILKNKKFFQAIEAAWKLFCQNWLVSLEMGILLFLVSFVATLAILLGLMVISLPFIVLGAAFMVLLPFQFLWAVIILGLLTIFVAIVWAGSVLSAYQIVAWSDLFITLIGKGASSKLQRLTVKK